MANHIITPAEMISNICDAAEEISKNENDALIVARACSVSWLGADGPAAITEEMLRRRSARHDA